MIIIECCVDKDDYIQKHGAHFNDKLLEFAINIMKQKHKDFVPMGKESVDKLFAQYKNDLDYVYIANMCKADYYGSSIKDDEHLALFIKDTIEDDDAYEGRAFYRWYTDMCKQNIDIDWDNMI